MLHNRCYKKIDAKKTKEVLQKDDNAMLLDVREVDEYRGGHIKNSKNIPLGRLQNMEDKLPGDKNAPIITYCLSGMRAKTACKALNRLGYSNIFCLGGLSAWPFGFVR